ncbi:MAG: 7-cyano-7-deazaguanine synthase QueC [Deltaproteobacteria bacterium]|nr:7-cyano-7-deazaguanine synthase QueC [Deltaproteobacteria bacterium]
MTSQQNHSQTFISLLSGGLDSSIASLIEAQHNQCALALFFDYGQKAVKKEIQSAKKIARLLKAPLKIIKLPFLAEITKTALVMNDQVIPQIKMSKLDERSETEKSAMQVWVPNRNGLFLNIAASFAEGMGVPSIVVGFNAEEAMTFPDNSSNFLARAQAFFQFSTLQGIQVSSPTLGMNKKDIVEKGIELNFPFQDLWSCYQGGRKMCGQCESCLRLIRAYYSNNIHEKFRHCFHHWPIESRKQAS